MPTDAITCPSCSAADRSEADRRGMHVCEYCGVRYRVRHGEPRALGVAWSHLEPLRSPVVLGALVDARAVTDAVEVPDVRVVDPIAEPPAEGTRWGFHGRIANDGGAPLRHARVHVVGISADGKNLGMQTTHADAEILEPGRSARFIAHCDDFTGTPSRFEYLPEANFVR